MELVLTKYNNILQLPTVNQDISSDNPILFTVVDSPNTNTFNTMGMKVVDQVLIHMDDKNYMAKGYSPLENLVHGLHMHEEWQKISDAYKVTFLKSWLYCKEFGIILYLS